MHHTFWKASIISMLTQTKLEYLSNLGVDYFSILKSNCEKIHYMRGSAIAEIRDDEHTAVLDKFRQAVQGDKNVKVST